MKIEKVAKVVVAKPEIVTPKVHVFEGTIAGKKFLFLADKPALDPVAEIPEGKTAGEVALEHSAEIVARAKANHEAVKALVREWVKAQKAAKALLPESIAAKAAKDAAKAAKKAEVLKLAAQSAADKAEAKKAAKLAKSAATAETTKVVKTK